MLAIVEGVFIKAEHRLEQTLTQIGFMIIAMKVDSGKAQILTIIGYYRFMRQYNARKQIGKGERILIR